MPERCRVQARGSGRAGGDGGVDWDGLYAQLIDAFGWTWEYVDDEMTLPRLEAILNHWDVVPPLAVSTAAIATFLGVGRKSKGPIRGGAKAEQNPQALLDALGVGGTGFSLEKPAWLKT